MDRLDMLVNLLGLVVFRLIGKIFMGLVLPLAYWRYTLESCWDWSCLGHLAGYAGILGGAGRLLLGPLTRYAGIYSETGPLCPLGPLARYTGIHSETGPLCPLGPLAR